MEDEEECIPVPICCNNCYIYFMGPQNGHTFFITNCYHIFCANCIKPMEKYCVICKATCNIMELGPHLPANVKSFFNHESIDNLLDQVKKMSEFQDSQFKVAFIANEQQQLEAKLAKALEYHDIQKKQLAKSKNRLKVELELIKKLKEANRTGCVTPDLITSGTQSLAKRGFVPDPSVLEDMATQNFASPPPEPMSISPPKRPSRKQADFNLFAQNPQQFHEH